MSSHDNSILQCPGCLAKFDKYRGFYMPLKYWFFQMRQKDIRFHCADAGRGKVDQEAFFAKGASKAHYGQSSHNYNIAIDTFFLVNGAYCLDENLYDAIVSSLDPNISWYGASDAVFKERPHFEWKKWLQLKDAGAISLVE